MAKRGLPQFLAMAVFMAFCAPLSAHAAESMDAGQAYRKPLLVIRYNQERVYYTRALKQAVGNAERVKPGVQYEVVSVTPSSGGKGDAQANLDAVVSTMKQLGVDAARIHASTRSGAVRTQEINLYVE